MKDRVSMKSIESMTKELSDTELKGVLRDIESLRDTGVLSDNKECPLRNLFRAIVDAGYPESLQMRLAMDSALWEAAKRWLEI